MPKKGGKKKRELQGVSTGAPAEVQPTRSSSQAAPAVGSQPSTSQPVQRGSTQAPGGGGPPRQGQQPGQSQTQRQEQSLPAQVPQQQSQASAGDEWVPVGSGRASRGQGRPAPRGRGESLGISFGRGQSPRHGPPPQGAWAAQSQRPGPPQEQQPPKGAWSNQGPRPGPPQQQQPPSQGALRDQGPRPIPPQQQSSQQGAWGGQNTGRRGRPEQSQQPKQAAWPIQSQPMQQATPQVSQQAETKRTLPAGQSAWGQPRTPATPLPQVPQQSDSPVKQTIDAETASRALSEVSLQEKQSTSQVPPSTDASKKETTETALQIPQRKNPNKAGTLGRKITVRANMMRIIFGSTFKSHVVHYDVDISSTNQKEVKQGSNERKSNLPKYLMRPAFNAAKAILFPKNSPAFDGKKNAYSAGLLPFGDTATTTVTVYNEDGKAKELQVTFQKAADGDLDLSWLRNVGAGMQITEGRQRCMQALDIILRMAPVLQAVPVGRSFFTQEARPKPLGGGMDCWVGHFQSAVLGWKPFLNIDVAHKGFPTPQPVLDLIKTICGCDGQDGGNRPPPRGPPGRQAYGRQGFNQGPTELTAKLIDQNREKINRFLKGLKVVHQIPGQSTTRRTQRVNELVTCPSKNSFEHEGRVISVQQYYRLAKGYEIKYPDFPCLWVGGRQSRIHVHVPIELCTIVEGQVTQKKLDDNQTSEMIRHAATGTVEREKKIMEAFGKMGYNDDPCMKEFGVSVSGKFEEIPARILDPPALSYKNKDVNVSRGQWNPDVFLESCSSISGHNTWTILNLNYRTQNDELYRFIDQLRQTAARYGVQIGNPATSGPNGFTKIDTRYDCENQLENYFNTQKKNNINLVIVVIPADNKGPYCWVKQVAELKSGILTQCLKSKTLSKIERDRTPATITNILLKINAKLNGVNHKISSQQATSLPFCLTKPCMIVGADVTHPPPEVKNEVPSIAAVVASHDPRAFQYNTEIRLQPPGEETILEFAEIMKIQLEFFFEKTRYWPLQIIYYRDGVGDSYFQRILQHELMAIRTACKAVERKVGYEYQPKITFLVVQKRHHTRFFPTNPRDSDDAQRGFNVKAGTIVDTEITHPTDIDFYLCSHASIQGTARPSKYRLLWDDANMSEDEIEKLTYYLCHLFARCTRSVRYPTPTYYADLAAFRARVLTQDVLINLDNLQHEQLEKLDIHKDVLKGRPMFFV